MTPTHRRALLARVAHHEAREWREARTGVVTLAHAAHEASEIIVAADMVEEVDDATTAAMMTAFLTGALSTGLPLTDPEEIQDGSFSDAQDVLEGLDSRWCLVV